MKVKWSNILYISCLAVSVIVSVYGISMDAQCARYHMRTERPLQAGDLVQHRLNEDWKGLVIKNPDGPLINLRVTFSGKSSYWNDTRDIEWKRE